MKVAIAGTGLVGLCNAILVAQHNEVVGIDLIGEKLTMLNAKQSPIEDIEIEDFLKNKQLNFLIFYWNFSIYFLIYLFE
jgi:UDPglucose 6-dehydrogenase